MSQCQFWIQPNGCQSCCINLWQIRMVNVHFGSRASGESDVERHPKANWTFSAASCAGGAFIEQSPSVGGVFHHGIVGDNSTVLSNAMEQGMVIAEVNVGIGAVDRILKMTKDGKSNNRELTNARAELDRWRARLLKTVHRGAPQRSRLPGALSPSTK